METNKIEIDGKEYEMALFEDYVSLRCEVSSNVVWWIEFQEMIFDEGLVFKTSIELDRMNERPDTPLKQVGEIKFGCIQDLLRFLSLFDGENGEHYIGRNFREHFSDGVLVWYLMEL
ncbi:MAG: hypothetical protein M0R17_07315 [Candidatus Omnitrophica bacterium]|jgi:hypothetical protein|nr:hypothetical protein [Candidatus Omnitrophota bacterium]